MRSRAERLARTVLCTALGMGLMSLAALPAYAANNDGTVSGHTKPGAVVTVVNPATGLSRSVTADAKGSYRIPFLPVGDYTLTAEQGGQALGAPIAVTVTLGNATNVNVGDATNLSTVSVSGTVLPVIDVSSTESATNISRQELARLPVDPT